MFLGRLHPNDEYGKASPSFKKWTRCTQLLETSVELYFVCSALDYLNTHFYIRLAEQPY